MSTEDENTQEHDMEAELADEPGQDDPERVTPEVDPHYDPDAPDDE